MGIADFKQQWDELEPKKKLVLVAVAVGGALMVAVRAYQNSNEEKNAPPKAAARPAGAAPAPQGSDPGAAYSLRGVLPTNQRNQGLEDMRTEIDGLKQQSKKDAEALRADLTNAIQELKRSGSGDGAGHGARTGAARAPGAPGATGDLGETLPPPVNFGAPVTPAGKDGLKSEAGAPVAAPQAPAAPSKRMKVWPSDGESGAAAPAEKDPVAVVIPKNSALEAWMLTGVNARPSGSSGGAAGSVMSANQVGSPFVSRIKGEAILPNGWRVAALGDCLLSGSAFGVLSTERANVIAADLSCVNEKGELLEGPVRAYGVDADGTQGIAGKVVSKQGSLLMQAALTGAAGGLAAALSPSANANPVTNNSNNTTQLQLPSAQALAVSAAAHGFQSAQSKLSEFYLSYAKDVLPVVEVVSGTRITWILTEAIELHRTHLKGAHQ